MLIQKTTLANISHEKTLRYDVDYMKYEQSASGEFYTFKELFSIALNDIKDDNYLYDEFKYCEIGNADKNGVVYPVQLDFNKRDLINENYYKKIENGNIMTVDLDDILISKVRPYLKKYIRITSENKDVYYTTAFLRLVPKKMPSIMYYCLRSVFYEDLMAISRQGKGYPTITDKDLTELKFNKQVIDKLEQHEDEIKAEIEKIERKIEKKLKRIQRVQDVIDQIIEDEFDLSKEEYMKIERDNRVYVTQVSLLDKNVNARMSYRWNKAHEYQEHLKERVDCCDYLGKYIISTKNGWSPSCNDEEDGYQVLGIDAITFNGEISFENPKYSNVYKEDISSYYLQDGDFLVSRGNTVDLVALASVVKFDGDDVPETVYPDLMIKVEFDSDVDKQYMAYIFNSFIGRFYFKNSTKGKNQTMVKVSPQELSDFVVPLPDLSTQKRIAKRIKKQLDKQKGMVKEIQGLRSQIEERIVDVVMEQ